MKKYSIAILLVMVIVMTMTACVNFDEHTATFETTIETTTTISNQQTEAYEHDLKVQYLTNSDIEKMGAKEISDFFSEMVYISETEKLSVDDMYLMGNNFYNIWNKNSACNQNEFETQSYKTFTNILEQAVTYEIALENLTSWTTLPVPAILTKYFSSTNFDIPEHARCYALWHLDEDDVTKVAKVFFENPLMDTNTSIPCIVILLDYNNSATEMAWEHFDTLSKATSPKTSDHSKFLTSQFCESLLTTGMYMNNMDKIANVAKNILANPYYDTYWKYMYFCNAFYNFKNEAYTDDTVSNIAFESLFELAKNADKETAKELEKLTEVLNDDDANKLLSILDENS